MNTMRMVIAFTLIFGALLAQENNQAEVRQVKQVVQTAYIDGFQNLGNLEDIEEGFHPGFTLLYIQNDQMQKLPLYNWLAGWKKRRAENPDGPKEKAAIKFLDVDVFGKRAVAQFEMFRDGKKVFTDVFFLMKFDEGWKIVSKISHRH